MEILKGAITALVSEGRLTLQVPAYCIGNDPECEIVPDSWFCFLQSNGTPCVGKQSGFLYLTKAGYEANKEDIKVAFEAAIARGLDRTNGVGWPAFEQYVTEHFAKVEKQRKHQAAQLQKKLNEINSFNI